MKALDIISRSIEEDAESFRKALIRQAEIHDDAALLMRDGRARQGAEASRAACLRAYDGVGANDPAAIVADCGAMIVALNVACRLQGLPAHIRTAAAVEWESIR